MDEFVTLDSVAARDIFPIILDIKCPKLGCQKLFHQKRMHLFSRKL